MTPGREPNGIGEDKNDRYYSRAANTVKQMVVVVVELFHHSFSLHLSILQI